MSYQQLKANLRGVAFTNPTPFSSDGSTVLREKLNENTKHVVDAGGRLLIPCGNTGEYYSLSNDERVAVVEATAEAVGDSGSVVAGVGGSTKTAVDLIDAYEDAGADAVMVMHPVHTYQHETGLVEYYRRLADSTDLGVVVYKRGPELTLPVIREVAAFENVVGVKYAHNDISAFSKAINSIDEDLVWSNGIAERFAPAFAIEGAEGLTTGIGNFVPEVVLALQEALENREWDRAVSIRNLVRPYEDLREESGEENVLGAANNVPGVKYGMELAGLYGGPVREPLVPLSAADKARAEQYYDEITADASV